MYFKTEKTFYKEKDYVIGYWEKSIYKERKTFCLQLWKFAALMLATQLTLTYSKSTLESDVKYVAKLKVH